MVKSTLFQCYIAPEDESSDPAVYKSQSTSSNTILTNATDVHNEAENSDEPLLIIPPAFSSLHITLRDAGLLRFVKYVSASAPSSRWDVCAEFTYLADPANS